MEVISDLETVQTPLNDLTTECVSTVANNRAMHADVERFLAPSANEWCKACRILAVAAVMPSVGWKLKAVKLANSKQDESCKRKAPDVFEGSYLTVILQFINFRVFNKPEVCGFETRWGEWFFFSIYLILPAPLGPGVYSRTEMSTTRRKVMFVGSRARPVLRADNLTAVCEPIVWTVWDP
jgi:hypothetical protein